MQVMTWSVTTKYLEEQSKQIGSSISSYAAHVLNQHYLDSLKK